MEEAMIQTALLIAATLTVFIGAVHSWLGERRLIGPLLAPDTRTGILERSRFARQVLRFAWHITTLAWWGMGAVLASYALVPREAFGAVTLGLIAATFFATGVIILVTGRGRHWAWPVFMAIAALAIVPLVR
jgi:hypothetical protein